MTEKIGISGKSFARSFGGKSFWHQRTYVTITNLDVGFSADIMRPVISVILKNRVETADWNTAGSCTG